MPDPKDNYFEFLIAKKKHFCVLRDRVISIKESYPDDLAFPKANDDRTRCVISIQSTDQVVSEVNSIEKYEMLIRRLYKRPWSGVK